MTKLLLFLTLLCLKGLNAKAQTLVIYHADGTTTDVELFTMPRIEFKNDKVLITSTVLDMEYPKDDVLRFSYKGVVNAINTPKVDADYSRKGDLLVFHGIRHNEKVAVYTLSGVRVPARLTRLGDDVMLPLSAIPSGVYMLSVNGRTSKFTKQ